MKIPRLSLKMLFWLHEAKTNLSKLINTSLHALAAYELPQIHKDPFDRMFLAQAKAESIRQYSFQGRNTGIRINREVALRA